MGLLGGQSKVFVMGASEMLEVPQVVQGSICSRSFHHSLSW